ncbi:MAG: MFS transporter [Pseudomonadota bacterium]
MIQRNYRNIFFISLSQFGMAFAFNFVMVFIPFLIHNISPYSPQKTLIWVGLIMGSTSFVAAIASTFWGSLTSHFSPKLLFMMGLLSHGILILLMAFFTSLPVFLTLRILQGVLGGISTVGFIIVSSSSSKEYASRDTGMFNNSLTFGQLVGPPVGALAASALGYKGAFIIGSVFIFLTLVFCFLYVVEVPHKTIKRNTFRKHTVNKKTLLGWGLCFTTTIQLMFLPSVLPNVFDGFNIEHSLALKWAGLVIMLYTATAVVGTHFLCKLATRIGTSRLIISLASLGILCQSLLSLSPGVISFIIIRMLQTAMIAAILPLVFSIFLSDLDGKVIGFLNSARFLGNALGPMTATAILAFSSFSWLYLSVSIMSLLAMLVFVFFFDHTEDRDPQ